MSRIWWALHQATLDGAPIHGVQSVGLDISVTGNDIVDYGNLQLLRYCQERPTISVTIERFLNKAASPTVAFGGDVAGTIGLRPCAEFDVGLAYEGGSIGFPNALLTELSYSFPTDGFATESMTFITHTTGAGGSFSAFSESGECCRRWHISGATLPYEAAQALGTDGESATGYVLQNFGCSVTIDYGEITSYGEWPAGASQNKWKYMNTPCEVTSEFTAIVRGVSTPSVGANDYSFIGPTTGSLGGNLNLSESGKPNRSISITAGGLTFDMGTKNYFTGHSVSGGDAGGGNAETTFNYSNRAYGFSNS